MKWKTLYADAYMNHKEHGIMITDENGDIVKWHSNKPSTSNTSNTLEYNAVIGALEEIDECGVVYSDSMLVVRQIAGTYGCHKEHLRPFLDKARKYACKMHARVEWISRKKNPAGKLIDKIFA